MRLGDSRTLEGPGLVPAQDHRRVDVDVRAGLVAVRVVDRDSTANGGQLREDEELHGDVQGLFVWRPGAGEYGAAARPCAMWRHAFPCVVKPNGPTIEEITPSGIPEPYQDAAMTGGGLNGGGSGAAGEIGADSRNWTAGPSFDPWGNLITKPTGPGFGA